VIACPSLVPRFFLEEMSLVTSLAGGTGEEGFGTSGGRPVCVTVEKGLAPVGGGL